MEGGQTHYKIKHFNQTFLFKVFKERALERHTIFFVREEIKLLLL